MLFTVHYLILRGFYAMEQTRTVFLVQCGVAAANIILAVVVVRLTDPQGTAPGLALAYGGSYAVGWRVVRRAAAGPRLPGGCRGSCASRRAWSSPPGLAGAAAYAWRTGSSPSSTARGTRPGPCCCWPARRWTLALLLLLARLRIEIEGVR